MAVYSCDGRFDHHQAQATPENQPALHQVEQMSWDDLWMRPVADQVQHEIEIYREAFPMNLADLRAMPPDHPILAEGAALLPELVAPQLQEGQTAVYLIPIPQFQHKTYAQNIHQNAALLATHFQLTSSQSPQNDAGHLHSFR